MTDRPYCLQELRDMENDIHKKFSLSDVFATHKPCSHRYRIKKGGRKEQELSNDVPTNAEARLVLTDQTCSVCYKIRTTTEPMSEEIIEEIKNMDGKQILNKNFIQNKKYFYKWLFHHNC